MTDPTPTSGRSRALFIATAPAVLLPVAVLGPMALFGVFSGISILPPLGLVIAMPAGLGLVGLAGLIRLWVAAWRSGEIPVWATAASLAGILCATGLLARQVGNFSQVGDDTLQSWLQPSAMIVALFAAIVLLASHWVPLVRKVWRRPAAAAIAAPVVLGTTFAILAAAPPRFHAIALRTAAAHADDVPTFHRDPFVLSLCQGRRDDAQALLDAHQVRAEARFGLVECLEHGADELHPARTFYGQRVGLMLDGLVAAERAAGVENPKGCTPELVRVIRTLASQYPRGLGEFAPRQLPVDCVVDDSGERPAWWSLVTTQDGRPLAVRLRELQAFGINPRQRTAAGFDLLGANENHVIASLTDDDLAEVIAMGLDPDTTSLRTRPFAVELSERRFAAHAQKPGSTLAALIKRHGEPTVTQLLLAMDLGQASLGHTREWDDYLRTRLAGIGPERVAATDLDSAYLRFQLRRLACARDHECEGRLGNLSPTAPTVPAPRGAAVLDSTTLAELARRDYRYRVICVENAARAAAAIAALDRHESFDEVLYRYGIELSPPELARIAPWTAGASISAARLAALGALTSGGHTRAPIWEDGRFLVLLLKQSRLPSQGLSSQAR